MDERKENEIMDIWNCYNPLKLTPVVSIYCLVYNHEKFIEDTICGFLMQETDFPYEIVIHDDASTDGTKKILEKYEKRYPNILKIIYEKENQYSKGSNRIKDIMYPYLRGKYIAFCEGDDYWCDKEKLKKQYKYMVSHPECSLCCHNTRIHDVSGKSKDRLFFPYRGIHKFSQNEVFCEWKVHTSSYFCRKEDFDIPNELSGYWCGDFVRSTYCFTKGSVVALPDVMSVYNWNNYQGITYKNNKDLLLKEKRERERINYLEKLDIYTKGAYSTIIDKKIKLIKYILVTYQFESMDNKLTYSEYYKYIREITNTKEFKDGYFSFGLFSRIKIFLKYHIYCAYLFNYIIVRKLR